MARSWDEHYELGELPWDSAEPDVELVKLVQAGKVPKGRALDVGCGTGTNALYLARLGYQVLAVDLVEGAVRMAREKVRPGDAVEFRQVDFLMEKLDEAPFDFVFDRGCFHTFDSESDRSTFAERVAQYLAPQGFWVSLLGSTEGPARDHGPPRRSVRDIARAVEPYLLISNLFETEFDADLPTRAKAWVLVARQRDVAAQPSSE